MSAEMSTRERHEVTRFGVFDLDILAEMEEHADDELPCHQEACDAIADVAVSMRCCGKTWLACTTHYEAARERHAGILAGQKGARCKTCRKKYPAGCTFDDIYRVVIL